MDPQIILTQAKKIINHLKIKKWEKEENLVIFPYLP